MRRADRLFQMIQLLRGQRYEAFEDEAGKDLRAMLERVERE